MDLDISKEEWIRERKFALERIKRGGNNLEEAIENYLIKKNGEKIISSLENFFIIQHILYNRLGNGGSNPLALSTYVAAKVGEEVLDYANGEGDYFGDKRLDFDNYPYPILGMIESYVGATRRKGNKPFLESITASFFEWAERNSYDHLDRKTREELVGRELKIKDESFRIEVTKTTNGEKKRKVKFEVDMSSEKRDKFDNKLKRAAYDYLFGLDKEKKILLDQIETIKNIDYFSELINPKELFEHFLLYGPPGTGKSTLASSIAKESGFYFKKLKCGEIGSPYVYQTAINIEGVFRWADEKIAKGDYPGVVLFFDEFDGLVRNRNSVHSDEDYKAIVAFNERLAVGGCSPKIIVLAATNVKLSQLDPAVFSRLTPMEIGYPKNKEEIKGIHKAIIRRLEDYAGRKLFEELDYDRIISNFQDKDPRYKSGRIINEVLTGAYKEELLRHYREKRELKLIGEEEVWQKYQQIKQAELGKRTREREVLLK